MSPAIPGVLNRPFSNYPWPLFQNESWCSSCHMKIRLWGGGGGGVLMSPAIPGVLNRPFSNYPWPLFQNESWCSSCHMKISIYLHVNEN